MQKAHLYEAILLVNRGIDDAVRGLERLKRAKETGLNPVYFDESSRYLKRTALCSTATSATTSKASSCRTKHVLLRNTWNTRNECWTRCRSIRT